MFACSHYIFETTKINQVMSVVQSISSHFKQLNEEQQKDFVHFISMQLQKNSEEETSNSIACPYCSSKNFKKNGMQNNVQKYKCKECSKNFRATHDTMFYGLKKKDKIELFISHMLQEKSLRQLAKEVEISLNTSWDWKRRIEKELSGDPAPVSERLEEILAVETEMI